MGATAGGGEGSRGVVGRGGERDGGDSGSNSALTAGASPLVLAAPPPLQELANIPRGPWEWTLCHVMGSSWGESKFLTTPARERASPGCLGEAGAGGPTCTLAWKKECRTD